MQSITTRPDWFQTVPLTWAIDPQFDIVDYFGELILDETGVDDARRIGKLSKLSRQRAKKEMNAFTSNKELETYKKLIADLDRRIYYDYNAEAVELNQKIDEIDDTGFGNFWELLGSYQKIGFKTPSF
ncbi:hypothetical protein QT972_16540 [Microcoleus sp. herbarium7]|uniref:hypothetical protein n=1 Tax=Microcoleus sp. herbarium7 TaxID=3055435 RepID=UPI002FD3B45E